VYRQIVAQIIDGKYAYMEKIHSDIKTFNNQNIEYLFLKHLIPFYVIIYQVLIENSSIFSF
jgi:hypothetical protein